MKILITGASGFIGKNLVFYLKQFKEYEVFECVRETPISLLEKYCKDCDIMFHLAGVNRTENVEEFWTVNKNFTQQILMFLRKYHNLCPVVYSSSTQAINDTPYGQSKREAERQLFSYAQETGARICVYRLPNVFGKWCRPNYNSVIATFCYNVSHDIDIVVNNANTSLHLLFIEDLMSAFVKVIEKCEERDGEFCIANPIYCVTLGEIAEKLLHFKQYRGTLEIPNGLDSFEQALYSTYLSYQPAKKLSYPLKVNADTRGFFTEVIRSPQAGQFSVIVSKPGAQRGNHWHNHKLERFVVVSGSGWIRCRLIGSDECIDYNVSDEYIEVIEIPPGYIHRIDNTGSKDMVIIVWCNECYDHSIPDTIYGEI